MPTVHSTPVSLKDLLPGTSPQDKETQLEHHYKKFYESFSSNPVRTTIKLGGFLQRFTALISDWDVIRYRRLAVATFITDLVAFILDQMEISDRDIAAYIKDCLGLSSFLDMINDFVKVNLAPRPRFPVKGEFDPEILKKPNPKFQSGMEDADSYIKGFVLLLTVILSAIGGEFLTFTNAASKVMTNATKNMKSTKEIIDFVKDFLGIKPKEDLLRKQQLAKCERYIVRCRAQTAIQRFERYPEMIEFADKAVQIMKEAGASKDPSVIASLRGLGPLMTSYQTLLAETGEAYNDAASLRPKSYNIHFFGPPGSGKTEMVKRFTQDLCERQGWKSGVQETYVVSQGSKYFAPYKGQKVILSDEFLSQREEDPLLNVFNALSTTGPVKLEGAHLHAKYMEVKHQALFTVSNFQNYNPPNNHRHVGHFADAFNSRLNRLYVHWPEYDPTKGRDAQADADQVQATPRNLCMHWVGGRVNVNMDAARQDRCPQRSPHCRPVTYEELLNTACERIDLYTAQFNAAETELTAAMARQDAFRTTSNLNRILDPEASLENVDAYFENVALPPREPENGPQEENETAFESIFLDCNSGESDSEDEDDINAEPVRRATARGFNTIPPVMPLALDSNNEKSPPLVWLVEGPPGAGKSIMVPALQQVAQEIGYTRVRVLDDVLPENEDEYCRAYNSGEHDLLIVIANLEYSVPYFHLRKNRATKFSLHPRTLRRLPIAGCKTTCATGRWERVVHTTPGVHLRVESRLIYIIEDLRDPRGVDYNVDELCEYLRRNSPAPVGSFRAAPGVPQGDLSCLPRITMATPYDRNPELFGNDTTLRLASQLGMDFILQLNALHHAMGQHNTDHALGFLMQLDALLAANRIDLDLSIRVLDPLYDLYRVNGVWYAVCHDPNARLARERAGQENILDKLYVKVQAGAVAAAAAPPTPTEIFQAAVSTAMDEIFNRPWMKLAMMGVGVAVTVVSGLALAKWLMAPSDEEDEPSARRREAKDPMYEEEYTSTDGILLKAADIIKKNPEVHGVFLEAIKKSDSGTPPADIVIESERDDEESLIFRRVPRRFIESERDDEESLILRRIPRRFIESEDEETITLKNIPVKVLESARLKDEPIKKKVGLVFQTDAQALLDNLIDPTPMETVLDKIQENFCSVHCSGRYQRGMMVKGSMGLTNAHLAYGGERVIKVVTKKGTSMADVVHSDQRRDFLIFRLRDKTIPSFKDITKCFIKKGTELDTSVAAVAIFRKTGRALHYGRYRYDGQGEEWTCGPFNRSVGLITLATHNPMTSGGDCGSPYLFASNRLGHTIIAGIHSFHQANARHSRTIGCATVFQEDLLEFTGAKFQATPSIVEFEPNPLEDSIEGIMPSAVADIFKESIRVEDKVFEPNPRIEIHSENMRAFTARGPKKSDFAPLPVPLDPVPEKIPSIQPRGVVKLDKLLPDPEGHPSRAFTKLQRAAFQPPTEEVCDLATLKTEYAEYIANFFDEPGTVRVLSTFEVVNGVSKGPLSKVHGFDMSTSTGFTLQKLFNVTKKGQLFDQFDGLYHWKESEAARFCLGTLGALQEMAKKSTVRRPIFIATCSEKSELLPARKVIEDGKVRLFSNVDFLELLLVKKYLGWPIGAMQNSLHRSNFTAGMDPMKDFEAMYSCLRKHPNVLTFDYSAWDLSLPENLQNMFLDIILGICSEHYTQEEYRLACAAADCMRTRLEQYEKYTMTRKATLASGIYWTNFLNSGVNDLVIYSTVKRIIKDATGHWPSIPEINREMVIRTHGDDVILSVSDAWKPYIDYFAFKKRLAQFYKLKITPGNKDGEERHHEPWDETTFLSRYPVLKWGRTLGRLKKESIKQVMNFARSLEEDHLIQLFEGALMEACLWDRPFFEDILRTARANIAAINSFHAFPGYETCCNQLLARLDQAGFTSSEPATEPKQSANYFESHPTSDQTSKSTMNAIFKPRKTTPAPEYCIKCKQCSFSGVLREFIAHSKEHELKPRQALGVLETKEPEALSNHFYSNPEVDLRPGIAMVTSHKEAINKVGKYYYGIDFPLHDQSKYNANELPGQTLRWLHAIEGDLWDFALSVHYMKNDHHSNYWDGQEMATEALQEALCDLIGSLYERRFNNKGPLRPAAELALTILKGGEADRYPPESKKLILEMAEALVKREVFTTKAEAFKCPVCSQSIRTARGFTNHLKNSHNKDCPFCKSSRCPKDCETNKVFGCDYCPLVFSDKNKGFNHCQSAHPKVEASLHVVSVVPGGKTEFQSGRSENPIDSRMAANVVAGVSETPNQEGMNILSTAKTIPEFAAFFPGYDKDLRDLLTTKTRLRVVAVTTGMLANDEIDRMTYANANDMHAAASRYAENHQWIVGTQVYWLKINGASPYVGSGIIGFVPGYYTGPIDVAVLQQFGNYKVIDFAVPREYTISLTNSDTAMRPRRVGDTTDAPKLVMLVKAPLANALGDGTASINIEVSMAFAEERPFRGYTPIAEGSITGGNFDPQKQDEDVTSIPLGKYVGAPGTFTVDGQYHFKNRSELYAYASPGYDITPPKSQPTLADNDLGVYTPKHGSTLERIANSNYYRDNVDPTQSVRQFMGEVPLVPQEIGVSYDRVLSTAELTSTTRTHLRGANETRYTESFIVGTTDVTQRDRDLEVENVAPITDINLGTEFSSQFRPNISGRKTVQLFHRNRVNVDEAIAANAYPTRGVSPYQRALIEDLIDAYGSQPTLWAFSLGGTAILEVVFIPSQRSFYCRIDAFNYGIGFFELEDATLEFISRVTESYIPKNYQGGAFINSSQVRLTNKAHKGTQTDSTTEFQAAAGSVAAAMAAMGMFDSAVGKGLGFWNEAANRHWKEDMFNAWKEWQAGQNALEREQALKEKWANNSAQSDRKAPGVAPPTKQDQGTNYPGNAPDTKKGEWERTPGGVIIEREYEHRGKPGQQNAMQQTGWGKNEVVHTPFNQESVGVGPSLQISKRTPVVPVVNTMTETSTDTDTPVPNPKDSWGTSAMQSSGNLSVFDDDEALPSHQEDFKKETRSLGTSAAPAEGVDTTSKQPESQI